MLALPPPPGWSAHNCPILLPLPTSLGWAKHTGLGCCAGTGRMPHVHALASLTPRALQTLAQSHGHSLVQNIVYFMHYTKYCIILQLYAKYIFIQSNSWGWGSSNSAMLLTPKMKKNPGENHLPFRNINNFQVWCSTHTHVLGAGNAGNVIRSSEETTSVTGAAIRVWPPLQASVLFSLLILPPQQWGRSAEDSGGLEDVRKTGLFCSLEPNPS